MYNMYIVLLEDTYTILILLSIKHYLPDVFLALCKVPKTTDVILHIRNRLNKMFYSC